MSTSRCKITTLLKTSDKENMLKAAKEKKHIQENKDKDDRFLIRNSTTKKAVK